MSKNKQPVIYAQQNSSTIASANSYSGTQASSTLNPYDQFIPRQELNVISKGIDDRFSSLHKRIDDTSSLITANDTRVYVIFGIIIAAVIAIFIFLIPYLFKSDIEKQFKSISNQVTSISNQLADIKKSLNKTQK